MGSGRVHYEFAERATATSHGGVAAVHQIALQSGLVRRIDKSVHLLKVHRPYHESDHVLNIAYNAVCGGRTLDIFNADDQELVWRGIGEGKARFEEDPVEAQRGAVEVMREILADFPPNG